MDDRSALPPVRRLADAKLHATADIHMSYVYPWTGVVETPFGSGWAIVAPGETTERHMHHEGETWFVMEGEATLTVDGEAQRVAAGDTIYLPPFRSHTLHNDSATQRVVFLTVYWESADLTRANLAHDPRAPDVGAKQRRVVVHVAPPTPNGDLHLGHLSGPYLAADVYRRALTLEGVDAALVMGTDDYQSYVAGKALQTESTPEAVADRYAAEILATLASADIHPDQFTRPMHTEGYAEAIQEVFRTLHRAGVLVERETPCLRDPADKRYLFEFYVGGACPHCGAGAGGGGCEECGRPNDAHDLGDPQATLTGNAPVRDTVTRLVVPLAEHADRLKAWLETATLSPHLRALAEQALAEGLPDLPATHPHDWGIPCPVEGFEDQIISAWVELGHGALAALREHARRAGHPVHQDSLTPADDPEIVQFFGFDNGYVYALLYPLLYAAADTSFTPPTTCIVNEFYLLDGLKFSTSRGHAIWVRDICAREPSDLVRFYVCHTRPEGMRTDFTEAGYRAFADDVLRGAWSEWLLDLHERLQKQKDGVAPDPGYWMHEHRDFMALLEQLTGEIRRGYTARTFSLRSATRALVRLVEATRVFAASQTHFAGVAKRSNELRTALALELAAARLLAQGVAPIMPRFAERLWQGLGQEGSPLDAGWPEGHGWVVGGTKVDLRQAPFPSPTD